MPELGKTKDIMNEVHLLSQLNHPNVVKCEGFFRDESRNSLFIILEYCKDGDLKALIDHNKRRGDAKATAGVVDTGKSPKYFTEQFIWHIFVQLCDGLKHLHEHGIVR